MDAMALEKASKWIFFRKSSFEKKPLTQEKGESDVFSYNMIFECQMIFAWRAWGLLEF